VLATARLAGELPPLASAPVARPPEDDPRPLASPAGRAALVAILTTPAYRPLLGEWLELAARAGRRVAPEQLPAVLDAVAGGPAALRDQAAQAGGALAAWLAARNERWSVRGPATPPAAGGEEGGAGTGSTRAGARTEDLAAQWMQTGLGDVERLAALRALRRADSAAGLRALEATFAKDPAPVRAGALRALSEGLGPADEPVLEAALADTRKEVRAEALHLLASLPSSRLAAQMAERASPLLSISGSPHRRRLAADPAALGPAPSEEQALARDGIVLPGSRARAGDPWWLARQVVATAPLDTWSQRLGLDPGPLVALAAQEGLSELLAGWAEAATRQRRADWAVVLAGTAAVGDPGRLEALLALLGRDEAEAVAAAALEADGVGPRTAILLDLLPRPWSRRLSDLVVTALAAKLAARDVSAPAELHSVLRAAATRLDPGVTGHTLSVLAAALASLETDLPPPGAAARAAAALTARQLAAVRADALWRTPLASLFTVLAFRRSLLEEMQR
jgi:hypothetical protein